MSKTVSFSALGVAVLALLSLSFVGTWAPARAQDLDESMGSSLQTEDTALQLLRLGRYSEAVPFWRDLLEVEPDHQGYRSNLALCLYETGKLEEARQLYEQVLETEPSNIVALIQTARVQCRLASRLSPKERERIINEARVGLERAARVGANCLYAIRTYDELKREFIDDFDLQLNLLQAPQSPRGSGALRLRRDPFTNPSPRKDATTAISTTRSDGRTRISEEEQLKLVQRLRALVSQIDKLLNAKEYEQVSTVWFEVEAILKQSDNITVLDVQREFKLLQQKANEKRYIIKRLLLRAFYAQGERMLTSMAVSLNESDYVRVFELWQALERHARRMVDTEQDFARPANDLLTKGLELRNKARLLEEIDKFTFRITGIVSGAGVAKAIVNGRVLTEDAQVYGEDRLPIEGLRVVKIKRRRVRFRYKDTDFERPIQQ